MVCFADPTRFITDPDFCYQEFARREEDHFQVFRVQVGLVYPLKALTFLIIFYARLQNKCKNPAGLFVGGPRLLLGEQVVFGHRALPGRPVQERDQPALPAQPRPEESRLELHSVCDRNTVSYCLSCSGTPLSRCPSHLPPD